MIAFKVFGFQLRLKKVFLWNVESWGRSTTTYQPFNLKKNVEVMKSLLGCSHSSQLIRSPKCLWTLRLGPNALGSCSPHCQVFPINTMTLVANYSKQWLMLHLHDGTLSLCSFSLTLTHSSGSCNVCIGACHSQLLTPFASRLQHSTCFCCEIIRRSYVTRSGVQCVCSWNLDPICESCCFFEQARESCR